MEAVGQLAGGIAHDFNNLLGVIVGYNDLACAELSRDDSGTAEYLGQVRNAAERASALTRQILAFSRRQTLRPEVLSLNGVISDLEPLLRRSLGEDLELRMDRHQLEQVLMNLALNSVDAMSSGGTLTIRTGNLPARGRSDAEARAAEALGCEELVALSVCDTGEGMSESTLQHVFEPFFTTKPPGSGSGLGMSVVYGVVTQSRGHIEVESQPGKGTTVHIYLPRVEAPVPVPDASGSGLAGMQGTETILVVEDEAALRELVARVLGGIGYEVMVAATGSEALAIAQAAGTRFDLLLTDVVLPGAMQGNDLVKTLRETKSDLRVLYMSGYPRDSIVRAGRLEEGVNLVEKPFTQSVLAAAIREVLDKPPLRPL
jgi:two-component system cell cycle sensor histidine kinase/response regulator CckA